MYLVSLLRRGRAVGTVNTYASELAHLLRFLYDRRLEFEDLDDDVIHSFSEMLENETDLRTFGAKRRGGRQVNKIIRRSLTFIEWYQELMPLDRRLIGEFGAEAQITVERRKMEIKGRRIRYLWHESMVSEDVARDVKPMAREILSRFLDASKKLAKNRYIQHRALQYTYRILRRQ